MAGVLGFFKKSGDNQESLSQQTLKDQGWELGFKGGITPTLYVDVSKTSLQSNANLVNSLNSEGIEFNERIRQSNGAKVIEVTGDDFVKLANVIGVDRVNNLEQKLCIDVVKSANWQFGFKGGMAPVLYVDLSKSQTESPAGALDRLGIKATERVNSKGHIVLEVFGLDNLAELNKIIDHPEMSKPVNQPTLGQ